jgi:hypothetical protein
MSNETDHLQTILDTADAPLNGSCRVAGRWYIPNVTPTPSGVEMLDAFIIQRIRREQESTLPARQPLRIEVPREPPPQWRGQRDPRAEDTQDPPTDRGVAIIDFTI